LAGRAMGRTHALELVRANRRASGASRVICGLPATLTLAEIAGRFIPTNNATDGARDVFGRFEVEEVDTKYSIGTSAADMGEPVTELIVRGSMLVEQR